MAEVVVRVGRRLVSGVAATTLCCRSQARQLPVARSTIERLSCVSSTWQPKLRVQLEAEHDAAELVDDSQAAEFTLLFNDIAVTLAGGNAQAVKVRAAQSLCPPHSLAHPCADSPDAATRVLYV